MKDKCCLYCYKPIHEHEPDFHPGCSRTFFGNMAAPVLEFSLQQLEELSNALDVKSTSLTGPEIRVSLKMQKTPAVQKQFQLVLSGLSGDFMLKPPSSVHVRLPENEDLTLHLAAHFNIITAPHSLIRLTSGELACIYRRTDRINGQKLALENMCQLTETFSADKYISSMEKIGKQINLHCTRPGLEALRFFETVLFCWLTGCSAMHLQHFALLTTAENDIILAPAMDLIANRLLSPENADETTLTIHAKKNNLKRTDFDELAGSMGIPQKAALNVYAKFEKKLKSCYELIDRGFIKKKMKADYKEMIESGAMTVGIL